VRTADPECVSGVKTRRRVCQPEPVSEVESVPVMTAAAEEVPELAMR